MSNFKSQIYEKLDQLDDFLVTKNSSERILIGFVAGVVIAALIYFGLFDISNELKLKLEGMHNEVNDKISKEEEYIDSMENGGFSVLEQQVRNIQIDVSKAQEILHSLHKLTDEVYIYSKDWFLTFDDASKAAVSMGLVVNGTDIRMSDEDSLGGMKHSSFVLFGHGKFSSILKYIDWLETYGKFISIDNIIIESKDNKLNFSVSVRNFRGGA